MSTPYCYRIDLAYNGSHFHGFQSQKDGNTIQDHLESALSTILRTSRVPIIGASRTDSGVSAYHQVCCFYWKQLLDTTLIHKKLLALLPEVIRVFYIKRVDKDFHPIRSSQGKIYRYLLWNGECYDPFMLPYVWHITQKFCQKRLTEELISITGDHDFTSFAQSGSQVRSYKRSLYTIHVICNHPHLIEVWMHGQGFLRGMVRNIIGSAVTLASKPEKRLPPPALTSLYSILQAKNRCSAYIKAPAHPLSLMRCIYAEDPPWNLQQYISQSFYSIHPIIS